ncbi:Nn.00g047490.m01.CDS01 [Neocucurbitaria sp. VM-36]
MAEGAQSNVVQLAEQLAEGFAALSGEYEALFDQQKQLESKLSWAKQQYLDLLKRFTPASLSQDHLTFLQDLERVGDEQPRLRLNLVDQLAQSDDVERKSRAVVIRKAEEAVIKVHAPVNESGVKIWSGPLADKPEVSPSLQTDVVKSPLEKDFTTAGTPSKLGCPFASGSGRGSPLATPRSSTSRLSLRGRRSKRPSFTDPIRAEICSNDPTSVSPSVAASGSAAVCPIRFLDQHDPEEVAKYFEKHKHELPRSHEVCITRFQSNQESIEQLDRKYGNLVNMIQGLGQKHQAWLPEEPEDVIEEEPEAEANPSPDAKADAKVQRWATAVSASLQDGTPPGAEESEEQAMDETRTTQFDRPFKEVRVGESPSRPWGITIPSKYTNAESSSSVGSAATASPQLPLHTGQPIGGTPQKLGKCPFDHRAMGKMPEQQSPRPAPQSQSKPEPTAIPPTSYDLPAQSQTQAPEQQPREQETPKIVPQMIFNGPVFLGYPPDQLIALLQNSNLGATMR